MRDFYSIEFTPGAARELPLETGAVLYLRQLCVDTSAADEQQEQSNNGDGANNGQMAKNKKKKNSNKKSVPPPPPPPTTVTLFQKASASSKQQDNTIVLGMLDPASGTYQLPLDVALSTGNDQGQWYINARAKTNKQQQDAAGMSTSSPPVKLHLSGYVEGNLDVDDFSDDDDDDDDAGAAPVEQPSAKKGTKKKSEALATTDKTTEKKATTAAASKKATNNSSSSSSSEQPSTGGKVVPIQGVDELAKYVKKSHLTVVDCYADWCEPCKKIAPLIAKMAAKTPGVAFLKANVDEAEDIAMEFEISAMPTFVFFKGGEMLDALEGANPRALQKMVQSYQKVSVGGATKQQNSGSDTKDSKKRARELEEEDEDDEEEEEDEFSDDEEGFDVEEGDFDEEQEESDGSDSELNSSDLDVDSSEGDYSYTDLKDSDFEDNGDCLEDAEEFEEDISDEDGDDQDDLSELGQEFSEEDDDDDSDE